MSDIHPAEVIRQLSHSLGQIEAWAAKAEAHAAAKRFDVNTLLQARLAPDMMPLVRQIGSACDNTKLGAARLTGKTAPSHADDQTTWADVRARVASVQAYLADLTPEDFAGWEDRRQTFPWLPGLAIDSRPYLLGFLIPNVYFHLTTAYAILRHNGVDVGKMDFLGNLPFEAV